MINWLTEKLNRKYRLIENRLIRINCYSYRLLILSNLVLINRIELLI